MTQIDLTAIDAERDRIREAYLQPEGSRPVSYTHLTLPTNREV